VSQTSDTKIKKTINNDIFEQNKISFLSFNHANYCSCTINNVEVFEFQHLTNYPEYLVKTCNIYTT